MVVRQGHLIAVLGILLVVVMAVTLVLVSGVALAVTKRGTDGHDHFTGTKGSDELVGKGGSDWIDGRAGNDIISGGPGSENSLDGGMGADVISGGPGDDDLSDGPWTDSSVDILHGGSGNDEVIALSFTPHRDKDKIYCGAGRDKYLADPSDYVDSSCEKAEVLPTGPDVDTGPDVVYITSSASIVPFPQILADGGGPSILLPAAALLLGSGILTYVILRRR